MSWVEEVIGEKVQTVLTVDTVHLVQTVHTVNTIYTNVAIRHVMILLKNCLEFLNYKW